MSTRFTFRLEHPEGTPATPPVLKAAVPDWQPGNTIALGAAGALRVSAVQPPTVEGGDPVLIVEPA